MSGEQFLRKAGYGYIRDRRTGHDSYVRRLGSGFYPRLHMYVEEKNSSIFLNLHLDQKQVSYEGAHAHNAEYDGEVVGREIERLKSFVTHNENNNEISGAGDIIDKVGGNRDYKDIKTKKKRWWKFW